MFQFKFHPFKLFAIIACFFAISFFVYKTPAPNPTKTSYKVCIGQIVPHPSLEKIRQGIIDVLTEEFKESVNITYQNANGNMAIASQIIQHFTSQNPDVIVSITTPMTQNAIKATQSGIPIIFSGVNDIKKLGSSNRLCTGVLDTPPLQEQANLIQNYISLAPEKHSKIAIIYSSSEDNAVDQAHGISELLKAKNIKTGLFSISTSRDITSVMQTALSQGYKIFYIGNDNPLAASVETLIKMCDTNHAALFVSDPESVEKGGFAAFAYDQKEMGRQTGEMIVKFLKTGTLPTFEKAKKASLFINQKRAQQLSINQTQLEQSLKGLSS